MRIVGLLGMLLAANCFAAVTASTAANKKIVTSFYTTAFVEHHPKEAADQFIGTKYIQHNPRVPDGKEAFVSFFVPFFASNPEHHTEITQVIADGDLVALHVHSRSNKTERGRAIVDIFRVEDGKIVEHWDVIQDVPEKSANSNTMF